MGILRSAVATLLRQREPRADASGERAAAADDDAIAASRRLAEAGRLPESLARIDAAAAGSSANGQRLARIAVLRRWGRDHEASLEAGALDASADGGVELARARAWASMRAGRADEAAAALRSVVATDAQDDDVVDLAKALQALGRHDSAADALRAALAREPRRAALLLALGNNDLLRRRAQDAEQWFRLAVEAAPDDARGHEALGVALAALDRQREAIAALERARALASDDEIGGIAANIAIGHCELGDVGTGVELLLASLPHHPALNGYLQIGPSLLSQGRFLEGWRQYEHRWLVEPLASVRADYGVPQWTGQPLDGRTILVRAEQGLGDVFQFVRYLPLLKARGARVLFQPLRGIDVIARRFPGVDHVVLEGEALPAFDYFVNLMSLPLGFRTTLATIPAAVPYLSAEPSYRAKWAARLGAHDRPRVGLTWAGRPEHRQDRHRSIRLDALAPLLAIEGVTFVSLQKGPAAVQAEAVPEAVDWRAVGAELDDLDDAAAVLGELDLLVCVDTGLAHLAGAMGKSVWMLLPTPSDYRWLAGREDTPWYPTIRLFRQRTPRDWGPEIARVVEALPRFRDAWRASPGEAGLGFAPARLAVPPPQESPVPGLAIAAETRTGFMQFDPGEPRVGPSLETFGEWLWPRLELSLRLTRPGMTVLEAGGGAGAHTMALARAVGPSGVVLAWEARAPLRRLLAGNLAAHALSQATVMTRDLVGPGSPGFDARHETIDDLGLARCDGIVVHESAGAEAIVAGAQATLWRCRPWLMLGADDVAALARLREGLREAGYRAWRVDTPLDPPSSFNRRDDGLFGGASAHALFALPEEVDLRADLPGATPWA
ncbi:MAG TPA: glycosyltransferase family 9 protein [Casimicrobiaceae bacterium]|nr:glycosyltransferase family 9 protein [Casimicrobiaceae bacterium]